MIISWNTRGLNKAGKAREISSRLLGLGPMMTILIETRVKYNKAESVRNILRLRGKYIDNYHYKKILIYRRIYKTFIDGLSPHKFIDSLSPH
jgi:hypothetical protein